MALYEGIALIQEKQAVVLDLGTDYTKFGFTGEAAPRCIIPSEFWSASERRMKRVHDYSTREELYDNLVNMLHLLYFRHVLVNPKERRVVVVESLLTPTLFRETLADVLYKHYEVSGAVWLDSARAAAMSLGVHTALVISLGARDVEVTAVVHGIPLLWSLQVGALGAATLHAALARQLSEDNDGLELPDHVVEDIKVKTCFVASRERACLQGSAGWSPARGARYSWRGRAVTVTGTARELPAERLFTRDHDLASLPDLVLQCIMQCPIDTRVPLADSVLLTGGGAELPGLLPRLRAELLHLLTQPPYSSRLFVKRFMFHAVCRGNCASWLGGALLAADAAAARERRRGVPPDWACLRDNAPEHYHWRHDQ